MPGQPWLVGKDVALTLGYERPTDAVRKHVDDEDREGAKIETPSGVQEMTIINESGLYPLVLSSKLTASKRLPGLTLAFNKVLCYSYIGAAGQQRSALLTGGSFLSSDLRKGGLPMSTSEVLQLCLVIIGICGLFIQAKKK